MSVLWLDSQVKTLDSGFAWFGFLEFAVYHHNGTTAQKPDVIRMSPALFDDYCAKWKEPKRGKACLDSGYSFRGIRIVRDENCPGVLVGMDADMLPPSALVESLIEMSPEKALEVSTREGLENMIEEIKRLIPQLEDRAATQGVARKLRSIVGPGK